MLICREFKIYRFKTIDNTIIYVGYTGQATIERFMQHVKDKYWINEVASVEECIIENEAQARTVEMIYINKLKPIFNLKDKFAGSIQTSLRPRDKKFNHSFYVIDGRPTTCIPAFGEDYVLVDFVTVGDSHIGIYYDGELNLYFSATDICNALNIDNKAFRKNFSKDSAYIKKNYTQTINGSEKEKSAYLCKFDDIYRLTDLCNDDLLKHKCRKILDDVYCKADMESICEDYDIAECVKYTYIKDLAYLSGNRFEKPHIKRRLAYQANTTEKAMCTIVEEHNKQTALYDIKYPAEVTAADVFSMIEDLSNEYGLSYYDVFTEFNNHLIKNYNANFWKVKNKYGKEVQSHYVIAIKKDELYNPFLEFYEKHIA